MSHLCILVVDDLPNWQVGLKQLLEGLGPGTEVNVAGTYENALEFIANNSYDLIILDLSLILEPNDLLVRDNLGMDLLGKVRASTRNYHCGIIILTGYPTTPLQRRAYEDYGVQKFIDKAEFNDDEFLTTARQAILQARLQSASLHAQTCHRLTITVSETFLLSSELTGPKSGTHRTRYAVSFSPNELIRRTDNLKVLLPNISDKRATTWRLEAKAIGDAVYEILSREAAFVSDLKTAEVLTKSGGGLWLQFSSPASVLGFPFELLRKGNDYLAFRYPITRRLDQYNLPLTSKPEPFYTFIDALIRQNNRLRILIVSADCGGQIPAAKEEAIELTTQIKADLRELGIGCDVNTLMGADASYERVSNELRHGGYHIFHYAGHGLYNDQLPEVSGLVLYDDDLMAIRAGKQAPGLTAVKLNQLSYNTDLRLVFLSCCLSASNSVQAGHGDFYGVLDALIRADIPIVLGYRWTVPDSSAKNLALKFYEVLLQTFSPGDALLHAREAMSVGKHARDDDTWASPVLLIQNP